MRRSLLPVIAVLLVVSMTVVAFAAEPPNSSIKDGKTTVGVFVLKGQPAEVTDYFRDIMNSNRSVIVSSADGLIYYMAVVPTGVSLNITQGSGNSINIRSSTLENNIRVMTWHYSNGKLTTTGINNTIGFSNIGLIVGGNYWNSYPNFPTLSYKYIADITGGLVIETDDGETGGGDGGILDWLLDFWKKFVDTIKGLFIPSADYFSKFFDEIKRAFDAKLGGLSDLVSSVSDMFGSLKNASGSTSLTIKLPDNQFFAGYKGKTVNVLAFIPSLLTFVRGAFNGFLVVLTVIIFYKKLIAIVKT